MTKQVAQGRPGVNKGQVVSLAASSIVGRGVGGGLTLLHEPMLNSGPKVIFAYSTHIY